MIESIVLENFVAALCLIWTSELKLVEHLKVELVYFARSLSELLPAFIFITDEISLLCAFEANYILAVLAFNGINNYLTTLRTY